MKLNVAKEYNKRKQNENENGNENEYDGDSSLIGTTAWQEGKFTNLPPPNRWLLNASGEKQT
jgi:hypothetical protein